METETALRPKIDVVVPVLDAAHLLPGLAETLLEGVGDGLVSNLVLSDGGSRDGVAAVAEALGATLVVGPAGRGGQIARGVVAARAPWVLILHADTRLSPGWPRAARAHVARHPDRAGWFRLAFDAPGLAPRIVAGGANLRARLLGLPFGDQGLLAPRALLAEVGIPEIPLMEDVALARRLRGRLSGIEATATTGANRYLAEGWVRRVARNLTLQARWFSGAPPERLARDYRARGRDGGD